MVAWYAPARGTVNARGRPPAGRVRVGERGLCRVAGRGLCRVAGRGCVAWLSAGCVAWLSAGCASWLSAGCVAWLNAGCVAWLKSAGRGCVGRGTGADGLLVPRDAGNPPRPVLAAPSVVIHPGISPTPVPR